MTTATTAAARLCNTLGNGDPEFTPHGRDAFHIGDGDALWDVLQNRNWTFYNVEAPYLWEAQAPDGSSIRYVEGDIFLNPIKSST